VARTVARGEIWTYRFRRPDKQRPVVVITRNEVILLSSLFVALFFIKSTISYPGHKLHYR